MDYDYLTSIRQTGTNYESQKLQVNNVAKGGVLRGDYYNCDPRESSVFKHESFCPV